MMQPTTENFMNYVECLERTVSELVDEICMLTGTTCRHEMVRVVLQQSINSLDDLIGATEDGLGFWDSKHKLRCMLDARNVTP